MSTDGVSRAPRVALLTRTQRDPRHTIEDHLGMKAGETSKCGTWTLTEVECLGACVNAPMVQINDMFFENLTPENTIKARRPRAKLPRPPPAVLRPALCPALRKLTQAHRASLWMLCPQLLDDLAAGNEVVVGPQNGLKHSMGPMGRTSLTEPPPGPYCRDLSELGGA